LSIWRKKERKKERKKGRKMFADIFFLGKII